MPYFSKGLEILEIKYLCLCVFFLEYNQGICFLGGMQEGHNHRASQKQQCC